MLTHKRSLVLVDGQDALSYLCSRYKLFKYPDVDVLVIQFLHVFLRFDPAIFDEVMEAAIEQKRDSIAAVEQTPELLK